MADKLYEIYEVFTEQLVTNGWKGDRFSWTETCRSEVEQGSWMLFELDNGFCLGFNEPIEGSEKEASLEYWFEDGSENPVIKVDSLEQLQQLLN